MAAPRRSEIGLAIEHLADTMSPDVRSQDSRINASVMFEVTRPKGCVTRYLAA